jgi:hypothetical protein
MRQQLLLSVPIKPRRRGGGVDRLLCGKLMLRQQPLGAASDLHLLLRRMPRAARHFRAPLKLVIIIICSLAAVRLSIAVSMVAVCAESAGYHSAVLTPLALRGSGAATPT